MLVLLFSKEFKLNFFVRKMCDNAFEQNCKNVEEIKRFTFQILSQAQHCTRFVKQTL